MAAGSDLVAGELRVNGLARTFVIRLPRNAQAAGPVPLVLVLHGNMPGTRGSIMRERTTFDAQADARGFVVAYPDGCHGCWADAPSTGAHPDLAVRTPPGDRAGSRSPGVPAARRWLPGRCSGAATSGQGPYRHPGQPARRARSSMPPRRSAGSLSRSWCPPAHACSDPPASQDAANPRPGVRVLRSGSRGRPGRVMSGRRQPAGW
jgi:hypothetical protein